MKRLSRRDFLRVSTLVAAGSLAAACAPPTAPPAEPAVEEPPVAPDVPDAPPARYSESPVLADLVQQGALPAVEERLPDQYMIVGPGVLSPTEFLDWEPGQYGGTMRYATARTDVCAELWDSNAEPGLMVAGKLKAGSIAEITPNVFESYEISEDLQTITFHLRRGIKWSDGAPCTTADVEFWYEDVLKNEKITPTPGRIYKSGNRVDGTLMEVDIVDDYTFRISFDEQGLALVAAWASYSQNWASFMRPAHYMKQFHVDYADPAELKALLDAEMLPEEEWWRYYQQRDEGARSWTNLLNVDPDYPTLNPWKLERVAPGVVSYVRNPYYWKVDIEGQQLPYIDRLRVEILANSEAVTMKILAGEVDWGREYASMVNLPLYKENEERGGFRVNILGMHVAPLQWRFNFTNPDPVWQEVVRDVRFRRALNMAINHMQVVDLVYQGFGGEPDILGVTYDPEGASALLDEMGMDQRDADGWRLGPDGRTFVFPLEVQQGYTPELDALSELLVEYWQDIGIRTDYRPIEATLYGAMTEANEVYVSHGWAHTSFWRDAPTSSDFVPNARLWDLWRASGGAEGVEPDLPWAKRLMEIADTADNYIMTELDTEAMHQEMWDILREQHPMVMPIDYAVYPLLGSARLRNVPTDGYAIVASFTQEQFFFV